jgi:tetratricopeptide (TPR) repeat protein
MARNGSTDGREGKPRDAAPRDLERAQELVDEASALIAEVLAPGRWPQARTVERFLEGDRLERVLSLYARAMAADPDEVSYPWNLASTLNRLGLNGLALGFIARAIHLAERGGDEEWSGSAVYLAMAEIAVDAGEPDVALTALARAREMETGAGVDDDVARLLDEIRKSSRDSNPQGSLAASLQRLPA